jgi:hypothetical protein
LRKGGNPALARKVIAQERDIADLIHRSAL